MSILSSQAVPPTLKTLISPRRELDFRKIKFGDLKMPFKVFWGSLELMFGAPGGPFGALLVLWGRLQCLQRFI